MPEFEACQAPPRLENKNTVCIRKSNLSKYHDIILYVMHPTLTGQNECIIDNLGSSPCLNHGLCVDHISSYICHCIGSYTGINCSEQGTTSIIMTQTSHVNLARIL